jgi:myosin heavy subunit
MLIRISLIIAIIAGLAVAGLNFTKIKEKVTTLQTNLKTETEAHHKAETSLAATRKDLDKTKADLKVTQTTLTNKLEELDKSQQELAAQTQRGEKLTADLNKTKSDLNNAQAELSAFHSAGMTPEQIVNAAKQIKGLQDAVAGAQDENKLLGQKIRKIENELAIYKTEEYAVPLPAGLKGKVLVADPKWNFVVLNIGENQGILAHGELLVNRNGKLVAKIRISSVQKDRSVANVMPGWQLGEVMEGDQVIPANPAS